MKKYFLFGLVLLFALPQISRAQSDGRGACSYHIGVSCDAGPDWDMSVICLDGWRDSTVNFQDVCKKSGYYYCYTQAECDQYRKIFDDEINKLNVKEKMIPRTSIADINNS